MAKKGSEIKLVRFGDQNMSIKKDQPGRRKNFRPRHSCDTAKDKFTAARIGHVRLGNMAYSRKSKKASSKSKGSKICPEGKAWAQRTFDTYPSAYANMAAF